MIVFAPSLWNATAAAEAEANLWDINIAGSPELPGAGISSLVDTKGIRIRLPY
jgi:hypothetical protein